MAIKMSKGVVIRTTTSNYTPSYKVYSATITQTGTNDPVVTVLENTLPFTFLWERSSEGFYQGNITFVGPVPDPIPNLTAGKTLILTGSFNPSYNVDVSRYFTGEAISIDTNLVGGAVTDGALLNFSVEIRVYP